MKKLSIFLLLTVPSLVVGFAASLLDKQQNDSLFLVHTAHADYVPTGSATGSGGDGGGGDGGSGSSGCDGGDGGGGGDCGA